MRFCWTGIVQNLTLSCPSSHSSQAAHCFGYSTVKQRHSIMHIICSESVPTVHFAVQAFVLSGSKRLFIFPSIIWFILAISDALAFSISVMIGSAGGV